MSDKRCPAWRGMFSPVTEKTGCTGSQKQQRRFAMTEQDALKKFVECANGHDLAGCLDALRHLSVDTLNAQDEDGYDMLISAAVSGNGCAVAALLRDNRCDRTHAENLCGMTAAEYAMDYPENSPLRKAFAEAPAQEFIYRDGRRIERGDIYDRIMDGTLECDKGCFDMLPGDCWRAALVVGGKVAKEDFERWLNLAELYWEGQIVLLIGDEQYGRKFVNWEEIRKSAEPHEWLSFLRDLPQYAGQADWDKLIKEGDRESWQALRKARPELQDKYREWDAYREKMLKKYVGIFPPFNLQEACRHNDIDAVRAHLDGISAEALNKNFCYAMPPGFLSELPLAAAVKAGATPCIELLLEHGADPDAFCRKNGKTPVELAADKPAILKLLNERGN